MEEIQSAESEIQVAAPQLEVIACTVTDAVQAERGGANRLEVIRELERGGLTPPVELVRDILVAVSLPVRVMLRESDGSEVNEEAEIERLCTQARQLSELPVEGVVLGFLRDGEIDCALLKRILPYARGKKATFHHAFDETRNPLEAIERLKDFPQIDRILTAGGGRDWKDKIERLIQYEHAAQPEIKILAGGGIDARAIETIRDATGIREFHVGRAARIPQQANGAVHPARVAELVRVLKG